MAEFLFNVNLVVPGLVLGVARPTEAFPGRSGMMIRRDDVPSETMRELAKITNPEMSMK